MTVLNAKNRIDHAGDGASRTFTYDFPVLEPEHLQVFVNGVLKTLSTHYVVGGTGPDFPNGGDVTFVVASTPAVGDDILFLRVVPVTQESEYPVGGKFPSKSHEAAIDKLTMIVQQITEFGDRAIALPPQELVDTLSLVINETAAQRAGRFIKFTSDGLGAETGLPPAQPHAASHQNGGSDEISVAGLSGVLADPQTPAAHAAAHQAGGGDAIKLDDLAAPDDNTDLNASAAKHGLLPKLSGVETEFLNGLGAYAVPAGGGGGHWFPIFSDQGVLAALTGTTALTVVYTLPALALVRFPILLVFMRWNVETTSAVNHSLTNTILQAEGGQGFQNLVSSGTSPTSGGIVTTFKLAYGAHVSCLAHGHGLATRSHGGVKQGTVGTFLGTAGAVGNWDAADVLPDLIDPFNVARTNVCRIQMQNSRTDDTATLVSVEIYGCNAPNAE